MEYVQKVDDERDAYKRDDRRVSERTRRKETEEGDKKHTDQPEFNNEEEVDQNAEQCHDIRPLPAKLTDNMTTKLSDQSLEFENICVRFGINPMIQPEPEDLPKDNPNLEIAVLSNTLRPIFRCDPIWECYNGIGSLETRLSYVKNSVVFIASTGKRLLWVVPAVPDISEGRSGYKEGAPRPKQLAAKRNQERVKSILLLAIPDEYLLKFHNVADAKSLWAAIKSRFGGNEESKKMQKNCPPPQAVEYESLRPTSTILPVSTARPSINTARPVNTASTSISTARPVYASRPMYPRMDNVRPRGSCSPIKRSYYTKPAFRPKDLKQDVKTFGVKNMTTAGTRAVVNTGKGKLNTDLKRTRWVWRPKGNYLDHVSKDSGSYMLKKGNPEILLQDHAVVDSGCSSHMTVTPPNLGCSEILNIRGHYFIDQ
ncbi:hypothetical protein Tco_0459434 [Tanacetum coccineum]